MAVSAVARRSALSALARVNASVWCGSVARAKLTALWVGLIIALGGGLAAAPPAQANWLTRLAREAGEAGGSAARHAGHGLDNLAGVSRYLKALPHDPKAVPLGAHVTPEGHWKFTNVEGEVFTAANGDEMARVVKVIKTGELTRAVKLTGVGATAGARAAIEAAGGSIA